MSHTNLALVYLNRGDLERAVPYLRRSLEINPENPEALNDLGFVHFKRKEWEQAVPYFEKAVSIAPEYAEAHYNLAKTLLNLGRPSEGYSHLQTALRLRPSIGLAATQKNFLRQPNRPLSAE